MERVEASLPKDGSDYSFSVRIDFDLIKRKDEAAVKAAVVGTDADLKVVLEGDKVPPGFTWTYEDLVARFKDRYSDFKQNAAFHALMKPVKANEKLCYERYLDPVNKKGVKKAFFNPNACKEFDGHYTRKGATLFEPEIV